MAFDKDVERWATPQFKEQKALIEAQQVEIADLKSRAVTLEYLDQRIDERASEIVKHLLTELDKWPPKKP